jgi:hypothetical protein
VAGAARRLSKGKLSGFPLLHRLHYRPGHDLDCRCSARAPLSRLLERPVRASIGTRRRFRAVNMDWRRPDGWNAGLESAAETEAK